VGPTYPRDTRIGSSRMVVTLGWMLSLLSSARQSSPAFGLVADASRYRGK